MHPRSTPSRPGRAHAVDHATRSAAPFPLSPPPPALFPRVMLFRGARRVVLVASPDGRPPPAWRRMRSLARSGSSTSARAPSRSRARRIARTARSSRCRHLIKTAQSRLPPATKEKEQWTRHGRSVGRCPVGAGAPRSGRGRKDCGAEREWKDARRKKKLSGRRHVM